MGDQDGREGGRGPRNGNSKADRDESNGKVTGDAKGKGKYCGEGTHSWGEGDRGSRRNQGDMGNGEGEWSDGDDRFYDAPSILLAIKGGSGRSRDAFLDNPTRSHWVSSAGLCLFASKVYKRVFPREVIDSAPSSNENRSYTRQQGRAFGRGEVNIFLHRVVVHSGRRKDWAQPEIPLDAVYPIGC